MAKPATEEKAIVNVVSDDLKESDGGGDEGDSQLVV